MLRHGAALLAYSVLTLALTWPLLLQPTTVVPNDLGDPLLSTWTLWWNAEVTPLTEQWWDGTIFFPARDALTLSDHRLGIGVITTPIILAGGSPVLAYNVAFLASFVLSASAAYALCFVLTGHAGAAFLGGLVFGFNPFRAGHLQHLELLCSFWLPIALLALHRWHITRTTAWLVVLVGVLTMQALTSVYYFAFFSVIVAAWLLWFVRIDASPKQYAALLASLVLPLALISPILVRYRTAHASMGLSRTIDDIEHFSADLIGLITAPQTLALWTTPIEWDRAEGALYPGIVAVLLVIAGVLAGQLKAPPPFPELQRIRRGVLVIAVAAASVAAIPAIVGPVATEIAGLRISVSQSFKPTSIALLFFTGWLLTTARVRAAWRERSPLAFYALVTIAMWVFALGPTGFVMGERFLYKAPYSWLMLLPGVDTAFRVPARFGMLAALTLATAVALAWLRLTNSLARPTATIATALVAAAITADSWIKPLALPTVPAAHEIPSEVPAGAVILELPLGAFEDAAAMYRAIAHRRAIVNGLSGYAPPHYQVLHSALGDGRIDVLAGLQEVAPLLVFVDRAAAGADLTALMRGYPSALRLRETATHDVYLLPHLSVSSETAESQRVPMQSGSASAQEDRLPQVSDGDRTTAWMMPTQQGTETFIADIGSTRAVTGAELMLGAYPGGFPRRLVILTSSDGTTWEQAWAGDVAAMALRSAIANQRDVPISISFASRQARYVQVKQTGWSSIPWAVAEFRVITR